MIDSVLVKTRRSFKNLVGGRFGKWTVLSIAEKKNKRARFLCQCECGIKKVLYSCTLLSKTTTQCRSCASKDSFVVKNKSNTKHGLSHSPTYKAWSKMKLRCLDENNPAYCNYGARGIFVCEEWLSSFENFVKDMGQRPDGLSLDRINNDDGYYKANCRWATRKEQNQNKRHPKTYKSRKKL